MIMENKRGIGIILTVVFLLLIPLVAMQFTNEVNWTLSDFVVAAVLLLGTGLVCEFVMRKIKKNQSSNNSLWSYSGSASSHLDRTCSRPFRDRVRRIVESKP
jgi:nitrate/nitrite transporter NarK